MPLVAEQILELFSLSDLPPLPAQDSDYEQRVEHLKEVQRNLTLQNWKPVKFGGGDKIRRPGELYKRYRRVEELHENAKAFHELAGESFAFIFESKS